MTIHSASEADAGDYSIEVTGKLNWPFPNGTNAGSTLTFDLTISVDPCFSTVLIDPGRYHTLFYKIEYQFPDAVLIFDDVRDSVGSCGNKLYSLSGVGVGDIVTIDSDEREISVQTTDPSWIGTWEVTLSINFEDYPLFTDVAIAADPTLLSVMDKTIRIVIDAACLTTTITDPDIATLLHVIGDSPTVKYISHWPDSVS